MHGRLEFRQRRRVDQLHREGQRDAERDRHHRRGLAPGVMAPFGPQQLGIQRPHRQAGRTRRRGDQGRGQGRIDRWNIRILPSIDEDSRRQSAGFVRRMTRAARMPAFVAEVAAAPNDRHHDGRDRRILASRLRASSNDNVSETTP
jgi:hypothetical protein